MIRVFTSNDMRELASALIGITSGVRFDFNGLFNPVPVIVPNAGLKDWLEQEFMRRTGANFPARVVYAEEFFRLLLARNDTGGKIRLLERSQIQAGIVAALCDREFLRVPEMAPVEKYLSKVGVSGFHRDRRIVALAGELAGNFENYLYSRLEMIQAWRGGGNWCDVASSGGHETWQRLLFMSVLGTLAGSQGRAGEGDGARYLPLGEALRACRLTSPNFPGGIHWFGFPHLSPGMHDALAVLAKVASVQIYILVPCAVFWDDIDARDPAENQFLGRWGKPGRDLLRSFADAQVSSSFSDAGGTAGTCTAIARIRRSILLRERVRDAPAETPVSDDTFRVAGFPSVREECSAIISAIWDSAMAASREREAEPYLWHDCGIAIASSNTELYAGALASACRRIHDCPIRFVRIRQAGGRGPVSVLRAMLRLLSGDFSRREVVEFIKHDYVAAKLGLDGGTDLDRLLRGAGIFAGLDEKNQEAAYAGANAINWEQGVRRITLGLYCEPKVELGGYAAADFRGVDEDDVQGVLQCVRLLMEFARLARDTPELHVSDWAQQLAILFAAVAAPVGDEQAGEYQSCLYAIARVIEFEIVPIMCGFGAVAAIIEMQLDALTLPRKSDPQGVVVGPISAIRGMPFRHLYIAGANEGELNLSEPFESLDLRRLASLSNDITRGELDVYGLIEWLGSPVDRFWISYVARDAATGEILPPAAVADEIAENAAIHARVQRSENAGNDAPGRVSRGDSENSWRISHVRHDSGALMNYSAGQVWSAYKDFCAARQITAEPMLARRDDFSPVVRQFIGQTEKFREPVWPADRGPRTVREVRVTLKQLVRFLECPFEAWMQTLLGTPLDWDDGMDEEEPLVLPWGNGTPWLQDLFARLFTGSGKALDTKTQKALYMRDVTGRQSEGKHTYGVFADQEFASHWETFESWRRHCGEAQLSLDSAWYRIRFGAQDRRDAIVKCLPALQMDCPLHEVRGSEDAMLKVLITGETEFLTGKAGELAALRGKIDEKTEYRHSFKLFLSYMLLRAANVFENHDDGAWYLIGGAAAGSQTRGARFRSVSVAEAAEYLRTLVRDFFCENHEHDVPGGVIHALSTVGAIDASNIIEYQRNCSGRRERNLHGMFTPLGDVAGVISRRFELYLRMQGTWEAVRSRQHMLSPDGLAQ